MLSKLRFEYREKPFSYYQAGWRSSFGSMTNLKNTSKSFNTNGLFLMEQKRRTHIYTTKEKESL